MEMFFSRCRSTHVNSKVGLLLLVSMTLYGFTQQCNPCTEGHYVKRDCYKTEEGTLFATQCSACQKCDGEGQTVLVNCTKSNNTVCGCEDGYTQQNSSSLCQKVMLTSTGTLATDTPISPPPERVWLLATVLALLGVVIIALALTVRFAACVSLKPGGRLPNTEYNII